MELVFDLQPGDDRLFTDESLEQIERIEQGLLDLEQGEADPSTINEVFRAAHTLKGSAATIRHRRMAELTHAMEDVFGAVRSGALPGIGPFADVLLSTIDVLRALVAEVTAGEVLTDAPDDLTRRLRELLDEAIGTAGTAQAGAATAAAVPAAATTVGEAVPSAGDRSGETPGDAATSSLVRRLLDEAPSGDEERSVAVCTVDPSSEWQAVRLLQVVIEAEESGTLVSTAPAREEIESGLAGNVVALLVRGGVGSLDGLRERMRGIDDVQSVEIRPEGARAGTGAGPAGQSAAQVAPDGAAPAASIGSAEASERRQADLGVEARDLPKDERLSIAGDRLKAAQQTIRIDVGRLDELMNLIGELVVYRTRLQRSAIEIGSRLGDDPLARRADEDSQQFSRLSGQILDHVTGLRMLPIETVLNRFPRVVRDVANRLGKDVRLVVEGKETELDRSVLEEVGDPLGHLVRNSLDHGIELPDERVALGKPAQGTLRLSARHADGRIVIAVEDDGRGMDPDALRRAAVTKGLMTADAAAALSDSEALRVIFAPGFSTARVVTDVSGRGVGMDVVRTNIERLGGSVDVSSTPGRGTCVSLSLPLTLAILGALLVRSGQRTCALPLTGVVETLRVEPSHLKRVRGHSVITLRGRVVPVELLDNALGDPPRRLAPNDRGFVNLVVVRSREVDLALAVDEFVGQNEIVLKSISSLAGQRVGVSGATVLADGHVGLVVDIGALIDARTTHAPSGRRSSAA